MLLIVVGKLTKERSIEVGAGEKLYNPFSEMYGLDASLSVVLLLLLDGVRGRDLITLVVAVILEVAS